MTTWTENISGSTTWSTHTLNAPGVGDNDQAVSITDPWHTERWGVNDDFTPWQRNISDKGTTWTENIS